MSKFLNLYVENGFVLYQTSNRSEKLDDEYEAHYLSEAKIAGRLGHELTPKFIQKLLEDLDSGETITDGESG